MRSATKRRHCVDELVGIAKNGPDRDDRVGRHQNSGCPLHPAALPLPPRSRQGRQWSDQADNMVGIDPGLLPQREPPKKGGILAALRRSPLVGAELNPARSHEGGRKVNP